MINLNNFNNLYNLVFKNNLRLNFGFIPAISINNSFLIFKS